MRLHSWIVALVALSLTACPKAIQSSDAGSRDSGSLDAGASDAGSDAGVDAGFRCTIDDDCAVFDAGLVCLGDGGTCIPGRGCNADSDCSSPNFGDYCYQYGLQCRCEIEPNDAGFPGICRRRRGLCTPCTDSSQCGDTPTFDPEGACKTLPGGSPDASYCLEKNPGLCGCGFVDDGTGYCAPASGTCSAPGCSGDKDCPSSQACDITNCVCRPRCHWDFGAMDLAPPGCPSGETCWVDEVNLDAGSPLYGYGRCHAPCTSDAGCSNPALDPFGGPDLECAPEVTAGGGQSLPRCRATGQCMDDHECPQTPLSSWSKGYCDRVTRVCKTDCRIGLDPTTGVLFNDCKTGYFCQEDAGVFGCVQEACAQLGGASSDCVQGQYCCGEDRNADGQPDPCPDDAGIAANGCYDAPQPPFCTACTQDSDCFAYPNPNGSPMPPVCISVSGITVCAPSTFNNGTPNSSAVPSDQSGCPALYKVVMVRPFDPDIAYTGLADTCASNADCSLGNDAGVCDYDPFHKRPDGGHPLTCICSQPGLPGECPNDPDSGITSTCSNLSAGPTQICVHSVVCAPGPWVVQDAGPPFYGCGL